MENVTAMIGDTNIAYRNEQYSGRNIHLRRMIVAGDGGGLFCGALRISRELSVWYYGFLWRLKKWRMGLEIL